MRLIKKIFVQRPISIIKIKTNGGQSFGVPPLQMECFYTHLFFFLAYFLIVGEIFYL